MAPTRYGSVRRLLLTVACCIPLAVAGCASESTSSGVEPPSECSAFADLFAYYNSAADETRNRLLSPEQKSTRSTPLTDDQADSYIENRLRRGFQGQLWTLAAASWPVTDEPDLKEVLKNIARNDDWEAEVIALESLCGLSTHLGLPKPQ